MEQFDQAAPYSSLKQLKRDLIQKIWSIILGRKDFDEVYRNGMVVQCGDEKWRRLFPRFFVYSTDYVERSVFIIQN